MIDQVTLEKIKQNLSPEDAKELEIDLRLGRDFRERLNRAVDDATRDWPEELKALDPGHDNPEARQVWVNEGRKLLQALREKEKAEQKIAKQREALRPYRPRDAGWVPGEGTKRYSFQGKNDIR